MLLPMHLPPFMQGITHFAAMIEEDDDVDDNDDDDKDVEDIEKKHKTIIWIDSTITIFAMESKVALCAMTFILLYAFATVQAFLLANTCKRTK